MFISVSKCLSRNLCISGIPCIFNKNQNSRERDLNFSIRVSGSLLAKNPFDESWELELGKTDESWPIFNKIEKPFGLHGDENNDEHQGDNCPIDLIFAGLLNARFKKTNFSINLWIFNIYGVLCI